MKISFRNNICLFVALLIFFISSAAYSQSSLTSFGYPELEVTPLASERLRMETERESSDQWTRFWPIQVSALATFVAGIEGQARADSTLAQRNRYDDNRQQAKIVGGSWLALTVGLSALHAPYQSSYKRVSRLPQSTEREKLTRERMAEEGLYAPAQLGFTLRWSSVVTNLASSVMLFNKADDNTKIYAGLAAATSFLPLIVKSRWERTGSRHKEYKKKIYGPITGPIFIPNERGGLTPGYGLSASF